MWVVQKFMLLVSRWKELSKKWVYAIHRKDFTPSKYSRVCELHFTKDDIITSSTATDSKTGKTVTIDLKTPRLKRVIVIPTQLPNCPSYLSKDVKLRTSRDEKLEILETKNLAKALTKSKTEFENYQKSFCYTEFQEFLVVLESFQLPEKWFKIIDLQKVTLFKLSYSPGPVITYSVVIDSVLNVESFLYDLVIQTSLKDNLKTPFISNNINQIKELLIEIDKNEIHNSGKCLDNQKKRVLKHISNVLDSLVSDSVSDLDEDSDNTSA